MRGTLLPEVDAFLGALAAPPPTTAAAAAAAINPPPYSAPAPPARPHTPGRGSAPTPAQSHTRLSELLLQSLLRLDAMAPEGAWEAARLERKGAVREVQGVLDRLDGGWGARAR